MASVQCDVFRNIRLQCDVAEHSTHTHTIRVLFVVTIELPAHALQKSAVILPRLDKPVLSS